jgi:hypothetical protein
MKPIILFLLLTCQLLCAVAADIPKHNCEKPSLPNVQSSETVVKYFNKRLASYKVCIDKFVAEQRDIAKTNPDPVQANQAFEAAESAIKEYNDLIQILNSRKPQEED